MLNADKSVWRNIIREKLEIWARWREKRWYTLGYGKTFLEKCLDGMPGTNCPTCAGRGAAPGSVFGNKKIQRVKCPTCNGSGRVKLAKAARGLKRKINPAFIRATRAGGISNPLAERIDYLVRHLDPQQRKVLLQEYTCNGRQCDKAERLKISQGYYSDLLYRAEQAIYNLLPSSL